MEIIGTAILTWNEVTHPKTQQYLKLCNVSSRAEIENFDSSISIHNNNTDMNNSITNNMNNSSLFNYNNSNSFRDVHVYDGKTENIILDRSYSIQEQESHLNHLKKLLVQPHAIRMIDILLQRDNYDPANKVDSADLLVWICTHNITPELFFLLEEQLSDNGSLGTCLQGSSHRIRQIYYAQKDLN